MRVIFCNIPRANRTNIFRATSIDNLASKLDAMGSSLYSEDPETVREWFGRTIRVTNQTAVAWQPTHIITYSPVSPTPGGTPFKESPSVYVVTRADNLGGGMYRMTAELNGVATALMRASGSNKIVTELTRYSASDTLIWSSDEQIDAALETTETQEKAYSPALTDLCVVLTTIRKPAFETGHNEWTNTATQGLVKGGVMGSLPISYYVCSDEGADMSAQQALDLLCTNLFFDSSNASKYVYRIQLVPKAWVEKTSTFFVYQPAAGTVGVGLKQLYPYTTPVNITDLAIPQDYFSSSYDNRKADYHGRIRVRHRRDLLLDAPLDYAPISGVKIMAHCSVSAGVNLYADVEINNSQPARLAISAYEITSLADGLTVWWESAKSQIIAQGATSIISLGIGIAATVAGSGIGLPALAMSVANIGAQAAGIYQQASNASKQVVKMGIGASMLTLNDGSVPYLEVDFVRYKNKDEARRYFRKHGYAGYWSMQGLPAVRSKYNAYTGASVLHEVRNESRGVTSVSTQEINEAMAEEMSAGVIIYEDALCIGDTDTTGNPMPSS